MVRNKTNKLYFDVTATTSENITFLCTPFTSICFGDRFGSALAPLEACTGSTPPTVKQQREVSAWFSGTTTSSNAAVKFVAPTSTAANCTGHAGTNLSLAVLPFLTVGGTVTTKAGHSAVFAGANASVGVMRHFCVQLLAAVNESGTLSGTLFVHRQHTVEV